eukprot:TRINITY_DN5010_c0_g1_i1.p1 TRINITY_DN5010_c0_g1~~TRINITY_DN5010_c0_g1_i1.p1  ORF type:complete len:100 (-),score=32.18 TRINITY_DN5010_c0_g1_i1:543-842(-)
MSRPDLETDALERAIRAELEEEESVAPQRGKSKIRSPGSSSPSLQDNQDSIYSAGEFQIPVLEESAEPVNQLTYTAFLDLRESHDGEIPLCDRFFGLFV